MQQKHDLHVEIAKVAHELFEKSGWKCGCELDNWLAAEKIVMERHAGRKEPKAQDVAPAKMKKASEKTEPKTAKTVKKTSESSLKTTKKKSPPKKKTV